MALATRVTFKFRLLSDLHLTNFANFTPHKAKIASVLTKHGIFPSFNAQRFTSDVRHQAPISGSTKGILTPFPLSNIIFDVIKAKPELL
jgi:hypothetical protein